MHRLDRGTKGWEGGSRRVWIDPEMRNSAQPDKIIN